MRQNRVDREIKPCMVCSVRKAPERLNLIKTAPPEGFLATKEAPHEAGRSKPPLIPGTIIWDGAGRFPPISPNKF